MTELQMPWKKLPQESDYAEVGNDKVGTLTIEKKNGISLNEGRAIAKIFEKASNKTSRMYFEFPLEMASVLLQSRVYPDQTIENVQKFLLDPKNNVKMGLIESLSAFLLKEKTGEEAESYLVKLEGELGKEKALEIAEEKGAICAYLDNGDQDDSRRTWIVFKSKKDIPDNFKIVENHTEAQDDEEETEPSGEGKGFQQQPQPIGAKSTGN